MQEYLVTSDQPGGGGPRDFLDVGPGFAGRFAVRHEGA